MKRPSFVRFFSGRRERDEWREPCETVRWGCGRADVGNDEADVRAWACWRPSGSLRLCVRESRMTEPSRKERRMLAGALYHKCGRGGCCLPGTSSVWGSARIPRFHRRRGASFSCVDVGVEAAPLSSGVCGLRQGAKFTMAAWILTRSVLARRKKRRVAHGDQLLYHLSLGRY